MAKPKTYDYSTLFARANAKADALESSPSQEDQDLYIAAKMALMQIEQNHNEDKTKSIEKLAQSYYDNALSILMTQQDKKLKDAETFCILQKQSPKETAEVMSNVKNQLLAETRKFKSTQRYILNILGLSLDKDQSVIIA